MLIGLVCQIHRYCRQGGSVVLRLGAHLSILPGAFSLLLGSLVSDSRIK